MKKTLSPSLFFLIQEAVHTKISNSAQMLRVWNPHCYKSKITGNIQESPEQPSWSYKGRKERAKAGSPQLVWTQRLRRQRLLFIFGSTSWGRTKKLCQVSLSTNSTLTVKLDPIFHFWISLFWTTVNLSQMAAICFALLKVQALMTIQSGETYAFIFLS